jgi:DNA-binding beta-propeller fold protein YncE
VVANYQDATVTPIALPSLRPGPPVPAGSEPTAVLVTPDGSTALVADFQTSTVTPIRLATMTPGPAIGVAGNPTGIAARSTSTSAYVSGGDTLTPIDFTTEHAGPAIAVGALAEGVAVAPGGAAAWVSGLNGTLIHVDLRTRRVLGRVRVGGQPAAVVIAGVPPNAG